MIPAQELLQIQADVVAIACDKDCQVLRKTTTPGSSGQPLAVWNEIEDTVAGMTEPTAGQLANYGYIIGSLAAWHVQLPVGTDVQHQDHLIIDGETLEVQVVLQPRSYQMLLSVLASEVK